MRFGLLEGSETFRFQVSGTRSPGVSAMETKVEEVVVVLPISCSSCYSVTKLTLSVVKLGTGSRVALTKSSTVPSCKKQFIWFLGTPRACQLNALISASVG